MRIEDVCAQLIVNGQPMPAPDGVVVGSIEVIVEESTE